MPTPPTARRPPWGSALARVLRRRCPRCARGPLFRGYGRLASECRQCGLVYRREQGAQTGSMYLSAAVTQCFAALVIGLVWFLTDWSVPLATGVSLVLVGGFCAFFLPYSQALWVAVEYVTDVINREAWTRQDPGPG